MQKGRGARGGRCAHPLVRTRRAAVGVTVFVTQVLDAHASRLGCCGRPHDLSFALVACRCALDALRNDGKVYACSVGQVVYVHRACRLGPSAFIVHEHARRRRRRCGEVAVGEGNARRVSRRISNV